VCRFSVCRFSAAGNKAVVYDLLFKASAQTTLTIAADPKHLSVLARARLAAQLDWQAARSGECDANLGRTWIRNRRMNSSVASVIVL
jgi:hypothetical protein